MKKILIITSKGLFLKRLMTFLKFIKNTINIVYCDDDQNKVKKNI